MRRGNEMSSFDNKSLKEMYCIKTTMMLMVLLYHSCLALDAGWSGISSTNEYHISGFTQGLIGWLNLVHIQTFVFASGFIFYYGKYEKKSYDNIHDFFKKKYLRLVVPYLMVGCIWVMPITIMARSYSVVEAIRDFILVIRPGQLWFLIMLFLIFVFFYFCGDVIIKQNKFVSLALLYLVGVVTRILADIIPIGILQLDKAVQFLIYFYMGMYVRKEKRDISIVSTILTGFIHVVCFAIWWKASSFIIIRYIFQPLVSLSACVLVFSIFNFLSERTIDKIRSIRLLKTIERDSMGIFLFHQQILFITARLTYVIREQELSFIIINFIFAGVISVLISEVLHRVKIGRLMLGLGRLQDSN